MSECAFFLQFQSLCVAMTMTGWFNAALAKIKRLSDKYHGRLRDCSDKSFKLLTNRTNTQVRVGVLAFEELQGGPRTGPLFTLED